MINPVNHAQVLLKIIALPVTSARFILNLKIGVAQTARSDLGLTDNCNSAYLVHQDAIFAILQGVRDAQKAYSLYPQIRPAHLNVLQINTEIKVI